MIGESGDQVIVEGSRTWGLDFAKDAVQNATEETSTSRLTSLLVTEAVGIVDRERAEDISDAVEPSGGGPDGAVDGVHRGRFGLPFCCGSQISGSKRETLRRATDGERQRQHRRRETEQQSRGP